MTVGPTTRGAFNVALGWLGFSVPPMPKQRRRPHRKTAQQRTPQLIRRLKATGCQPRQVGDGQWLALCPTCSAEGRQAVVEIRRADDGTLVMACQEAHGERRAA